MSFLHVHDTAGVLVEDLLAEEANVLVVSCGWLKINKKLVGTIEGDSLKALPACVSRCFMSSGYVRKLALHLSHTNAVFLLTLDSTLLALTSLGLILSFGFSTFLSSVGDSVIACIRLISLAAGSEDSKSLFESFRLRFDPRVVGDDSGSDSSAFGSLRR